MTADSRTVEIECAECESLQRLPLTALSEDIDALEGDMFLFDLPGHPLHKWKIVQ